jgi:hypothetical protein
MGLGLRLGRLEEMPPAGGLLGVFFMMVRSQDYGEFWPVAINDSCQIMNHAGADGDQVEF